MSETDWTHLEKIITTIGVISANIIVVVSMILSAIGRAQAQVANAQAVQAAQTAATVAQDTKVVVDGQMGHILETKAVLADKLVTMAEKVASSTTALPTDIIAVIQAQQIQSDTKKAVEDHAKTTEKSDK